MKLTHPHLHPLPPEGEENLTLARAVWESGGESKEVYNTDEHCRKLSQRKPPSLFPLPR
jgi:hypothetical protein